MRQQITTNWTFIGCNSFCWNLGGTQVNCWPGRERLGDLAPNTASLPAQMFPNKGPAIQTMILVSGPQCKQIQSCSGSIFRYPIREPVSTRKPEKRPILGSDRRFYGLHWLERSTGQVIRLVPGQICYNSSRVHSIMTSPERIEKRWGLWALRSQLTEWTTVS